MRKLFGSTSVLILLAILVVSCSSSSTTAAPASSPPSTETIAAESSSGSSLATPDGKTLLESRCANCHDLDTVVNRKGTADEWKMVVDSHIQRGVELSSEEATVLVQYLAENFK